LGHSMLHKGQIPYLEDNVIRAKHVQSHP